MEVVEFLNDGNLSQNQWGEFVSLDSTSQHDGHVFQDVVTLAPVDTQSTPQYYFVDADGSLLPIFDGDNIAFLADTDNEIPSWKLDHMYAKKPREPGMEQVKPTKRRSKKKELLTSQFFVQDMVDDTPPKINIIRQRHAAGYSRPKILTSPHKFSSTNTSYYPSASASSGSTFSSFNVSKVKTLGHHHESLPHTNEEFKVPSPGAVVTVCDGMELEPIIVNSRTSKPPKKFMYNVSSSMLPAQLEIRNSSLYSIGEPEDDSELFFDFPMEEEEEGATIDVDFNEISMNTGGSSKEILDSTTPIPFFNHSTSNSTELEVDQPLLENFIRVNAPLLSSWNPIPSSVSNNNHHSDHQKNNLQISPNTPLSVRKRGRPRKNQSPDSLKSPKTIPKVKEKQSVPQSITPTRRSTRPVKVPSRLAN